MRLIDRVVVAVVSLSIGSAAFGSFFPCARSLAVPAGWCSSCDRVLPEPRGLDVYGLTRGVWGVCLLYSEGAQRARGAAATICLGAGARLAGAGGGLQPGEASSRPV
jgi:hypothetical protein